MIYICEWDDECTNPVEGTTKYCATHNHQLRKEERLKLKKSTKAPQARIKPVSKKMSRQMSQYSKEKDEWITDKICPITGEPADQIHHMKGRAGYADQWALDNGITLIMDKRFWLGVSQTGHNQINENPDWAIKMGYSISRTAKI
jgi:hypothetical protein